MKKAKVTFRYDKDIFKEDNSFEDYMSLFEDEGIHMEYIEYIEDRDALEYITLILSDGTQKEAFAMKPFTEVDKAIAIIDAYIEIKDLEDAYYYPQEEQFKIEWVVKQEEGVYREVDSDSDEVTYPILVHYPIKKEG